VFTRLMNLLKAKMNRGMAKLETPEILAEQAQEQLETSVKKTKEAMVGSVTNEKMLEQQLKKCQDEVPIWEKRAAMAVQQNNDQIARECLLKKQELAQNADMLTKQLEEQKASTASLKKRYEEIGEQYKDFQRKKANLSARGNASDAVSKATQLLGSGPTGTDKWEQKIAEKEFKAAAEREMGHDAAKDKIDDQLAKADVDDELAALKANMQGAKLIVDKDEPTKTIVDDNLPMVVEPKDEKDQKKDDKK
jgi:phage shock protein A